MVAGKRQTAWPASTVSRASASGWRWRRRAWECAAGFAGGRSPFLPARDQKSAYGRRKGRAGRCCWALKRPGARKGRHFVQGKACPIVFRVGMFGYVRLSYVRYFCWSLAQPQMPPDRYLPICIGKSCCRHLVLYAGTVESRLIVSRSVADLGNSL